MKLRKIVRGVLFASLFLLYASCAVRKGVVKKPGEEGKAPEIAYRGVGDARKEMDLGFKVITEGEAKGKIDYNTALQHFTAASQADPDHIFAYLNSGICYERLGKYAEAEKMYLNAIGKNPEFIQAYFNLGRVYSNLKRPEEAIRLYEDFLKKYPDELKIKNNLAGVYSSMGNHEKAIEILQEILKKDAKNSQAYRNLSKIYFDQKKFELSKLLSANAQKLNPSDAGIANNLGITFLTEGDELSAVKAFKDALKIDPNNVEANMNLGLIAIKSGDYKLAKDCFSTVLQLFPGDVKARLSLALALRGLREFDSAIKEYENILSLSPDDPIALYNLGVLYEISLYNYDKAITLYEKYIELNKDSLPPDDPVYRRLEIAKAEKEKILTAKAEEEERKKKTEEAKAKLKVILDEFKAFFDRHKGKFTPEEVQDMQYLVMEGDMAMEQGILEAIEDVYGIMQVAHKDYRDRIADKIESERKLEEARAKGKILLKETLKVLNESRNELPRGFTAGVEKSLESLRSAVEGDNRAKMESSIKECTPLKEKIIAVVNEERSKKEEALKLLEEKRVAARAMADELSKIVEGYRVEIPKTLLDLADTLLGELRKSLEGSDLKALEKAIQKGGQLKGKLSPEIKKIEAKREEERKAIEKLKSELSSLIKEVEESIKGSSLPGEERKEITDSIQSARKILDSGTLPDLEAGLKDIRDLNKNLQNGLKEKREEPPPLLCRHPLRQGPERGRKRVHQ